jgi:hypothetical protein
MGNVRTHKAAFFACLLITPAAVAGVIVGNPIDVIGSLSPATFTGDRYGTNTYKDWGNEPSIAVNPTNLNQMVISSFSYSAGASSGANIFYSTNGGSSWTSQFSVPRPATGVGIPNDWRFQYDSSGTLHAAVLGGCSNCNIFQGSTNDPTSLAAWSWTGAGAPINTAASLTKADQPWIAIAPGKEYVAYDDFHSATNVRVTVSSDNGASFPVDHSMINAAQSSSVNPGTRIAVDGAGNLFAVYTFGTAVNSNGVHNVTYYLNRSSDGGNTWDFLGSSAVGGIVVGSGVSDQLNNNGTQASNNWFAGVNDLRGSYTSIAADSTGSHIYVTWGKRDINNIDRIYLTEFHPSGNSLVAGSTSIVSLAGQWAALPSLTVLADGTVVVMYDAYDSQRGTVNVHVASSSDFGASFATDSDIYSFTPLSLLLATGSSTSNREFGDYQFITSMGNQFFGAFVARGNNLGNNDTSNLVDPFFFSGSSVPEPAGLIVPGLALVFGLKWGRSQPRKK